MIARTMDLTRSLNKNCQPFSEAAITLIFFLGGASCQNTVTVEVEAYILGTNLGINLEATYNFVNLEIQMRNCSNPTNFSTLMFPGRQEDMECRGNVFVCFYVGVVPVVGRQGNVVNVAT